MGTVATPVHSDVRDTAASRAAIQIASVRRWFDPSRESLWAKIVLLEQTLAVIEPRDESGRDLRARSIENVRNARECIESRWRHPHLAWRFLHRADEDLLLLLPFAEVRVRAIDIKAQFDANITERALRSVWLGTEGGEKGALVKVLDRLQKADAVDEEQVRETLRAALREVNVQADRRFWILSSNVLTSVFSGGLLALAGGAFIWWQGDPGFPALDQIGQQATNDLLPIALLGAIGAFVSNLLTKENFLFVPGAPYLRYFLHPLGAKPVLSAFAAVFVYIVARTNLLFSIGPAEPGTAAAPIAVLGVPPDAQAFAYAVLAIASGFAADKVLRSMIDRVLKRLEENAEKTQTSTGGSAA